MRPRFSLRLLLILLAIFGVLLYLFIAMPTVKANRLSTEFKRGDFTALDHAEYGSSLMSNTSIKQSLEDWANKGRPIDVTIEPRTWDDFWLSRRRLTLVGGYEVIETAYPGQQFSSLKNVFVSRRFQTNYDIRTGLGGTCLVRRQTVEIMPNSP